MLTGFKMSVYFITKEIKEELTPIWEKGLGIRKNWLGLPEIKNAH